MTTRTRRPIAERLPAVVARGEEGMISLVSLFAVLGLLILFGLFVNVGRVTARKLETQNAADAVAHGAAVEMARGLNAVTTANHLIGELSALCILHHGFGGDELDDDEKPPGTRWDIRLALDISYNVCRIACSLGNVLRPVERAYTEVKKQPEVGGAIYDSRIRLKQVLCWAYTAHAVGGFLAAVAEKIPVLGPILSAIIHTAFILPAMAFEWKCLGESYTLDGLERMARILRPVKKALVSAVIPGIHWYARAAVWQTPWQMEKAAEEIGDRNQSAGKLFPGFVKNPSWPLLQMPVDAEPEHPRDWRKTQLVRAATPWVQFWRVPWLKFGEDALLLARFKCHYWDRTDEYTKTLTRRLREDKGVRLYILKGWEPGRREKGTEDWTRAAGSREADDLFCTVGFAHRPAARVTSFRLFRQTNPDGMVAYAQGMAYGANPQRGAAGGGQPQLGWDTLHWVNAVREFPGARPADDTYPVPVVAEPRVRVNWQAKLVPTTRFAESIWRQTGAHATVIRRTPFWHMNLTGTH